MTWPSRSIGVYEKHDATSASPPSNCTADRALPSSSKFGCYEPKYSGQCCTAASHGACTRATTTRCKKPTIASSLTAYVDERTIAPTNRFPIWTSSLRRGVRASRRLCAGGGSCSQDLWRVWRTRECRSAGCLNNWWGAWAVGGGAGKIVDGGVFWTTSELSV